MAKRKRIRLSREQITKAFNEGISPRELELEVALLNLTTIITAHKLRCCHKTGECDKWDRDDCLDAIDRATRTAKQILIN